MGGREREGSFYPPLRWGSLRPSSQSSSAPSENGRRASSLMASARRAWARAKLTVHPPHPHPGRSPLQGTASSWWPCMSWATRWGWSTPATPVPSWRHSTSGWTPTPSSCPRTTSGASSSSTVSGQCGHGQRALHSSSQLPALRGIGATALPVVSMRKQAQRGLVTCPHRSGSE